MENSKRNYFTTGEFAKLCNVTKHTLFHYDKEQIFSPEIKDENGYRYYSAFQFNDFEVIAILRKTGMPLRKIKEFLFSHKSSAEALSFFKRQEDIVEKKIETLSKIKFFLQNKVKLTEKAVGRIAGEVSLQHENEESYVKNDDSLTKEGQPGIETLFSFIDLCQKNGIKPPYTLGGQHTVEDIKSGEYGRYNSCYVITDPSVRGDYIKVKPQGEYLVIYHNGGFGSTSESYRKILDYANSKALEFSGNFFEDLLFGGLSDEGKSEYFLKISVKIENSYV